MKLNFNSLANKGILQLQPYQPGKPIDELKRETGLTEIIKLASNENPLGPSPKAIAAIQNCLAEIHRYPDGSGYLLKVALGHHLSISPDQIILGNGSDNILSLVAQAFVKPDHEIIISNYAFATFAIIAYAVGAKPVFIPTNNWNHDLEATAKAVTAQTQLIFIANPNNPTGTWLKEADLIKFLDAIPPHILVVMDEAYNEYVTEKEYPKSIALLKDYPNLVITRTFSKIYGLAGLRVGFGIASSELIEILNRVRLPFNVNTPAQVGAIAALEDKAHVRQSLEINQSGMQQLTQGFNRLGLDFIPSAANFITVAMDRDGLSVYHDLLQKGIIVRPLTGYQMPKHLRISIGLPEENTSLLQNLELVRL